MKVDIEFFIYNNIRKIYRVLTGYKRVCEVGNIRNDLVQYSNQEAQTFIYLQLEEAYSCKRGFMIAKFGTYELNALILYLYNYTDYASLKTWRILKSTTGVLHLKDCIHHLHLNAGVFPETIEAAKYMAKRYYLDIGLIDILASYQLDEQLIKSSMKKCVYVNLDGFFSPFMFNQPWTKFLANKRVLIVHPFVDSIKEQYENKRSILFDNPDVLPSFASVYYIKAIQSAAGHVPEGYNNWGEALSFMEKEMDRFDYEVALVGCGAYGLPLAAHAKRMGKIGIHLASMTQMLFGVYGKRWQESEPQYKKYIKDSWIRPKETEQPPLKNLVEDGCYW